MRQLFCKLIERIVAPGADILLKSIEPCDPGLTPSTLATEQWVKLVDAFHRWPFKPDVMEDETYITDDPMEDYQTTMIMPGGIADDVFSSLDAEAEEFEAEGLNDHHLEDNKEEQEESKA